MKNTLTLYTKKKITWKNNFVKSAFIFFKLNPNIQLQKLTKHTSERKKKVERLVLLGLDLTWHERRKQMKEMTSEIAQIGDRGEKDEVDFQVTPHTQSPATTLTLLSHFLWLCNVCWNTSCM